MQIARTLARFLIGNRKAIEHIATSRAALWASLVFVLSAGFAREYDGEYLLAEPWHFLRPIGASFASGSVLFFLIHPWIRANFNRDEHTVPFFVAYRRFMTCFWMTAPLAWLYAIPYERFMSPADAVRVNLWTLALVAAWRVSLITRVASVLYTTKFKPMFFVVMMFSDIVAFAVVSYIPAPVMDFMGGIQHTERDAIMRAAVSNVQFLSVITAPVWIIGAISVLGSHPRVPASLGASGIRAQSWYPIMAASLLIWIPPLLIAQPEQARRHQAMQHFESGDITAALAAISQYERHELPMRWELPPRMGYRERTPDLDEIRTEIDAQPTAAWVAAEYAEKIARKARRRIMPFTNSWTEVASRIEDRYPESFGLTYGWQDLDQSDHSQMQFILQHADLADDERAALQTLTDRLERALNEPPADSDP